MTANVEPSKVDDSPFPRRKGGWGDRTKRRNPKTFPFPHLRAAVRRAGGEKEKQGSYPSPSLSYPQPPSRRGFALPTSPTLRSELPNPFALNPAAKRPSKIATGFRRLPPVAIDDRPLRGEEGIRF
jgi:hypothetical protein